MALTKAQIEAIQRAQRKAAAQRAATQRTKISATEARKASSTMNKRAGGSPSYTLRDTNLLSKSELKTLGKTQKANATKEKAIQKQRSFAKGEGKLPTKERVGTKAEYKQLGKEIQTRKQLIAYGKAARAAQAERAKNPKPVQATTEKATKPVATKKPTPAKKTTTTPKASTAAIKKRTSAPKVTVANSTTPAPKTKKPKASKAPKTIKPTMLGPEKVGTTAEYKALAAENKAKAAYNKAAKDAPKVASKPTVKGKIAAAKQTSLGKQASAAGKKIASSKAGKVAKVGGKIFKIGAIIQTGREVGQVVSGQAEKDFRRIQALENRIAVAQGKKPKYTKSGSNRNFKQNMTVDLSNAANIVSGGLAGQSRKDRLEELKQMLKKVEGKKTTAGKPPVKPPVKPSTKPPVTTTPGGNKPGAGSTPGGQYRVVSGDTLSAIAARSGVSLKELREANPKFATNPKYKNGNLIWSGTTVSIPKKKK